MAHTVVELDDVGDKVYGVARLDRTRGPERLIWDDGIEVLQDPLPDGADDSIIDMTVSNDGWLGLSDTGVVYAFGPEGIRNKRTLPGSGYSDVQGTSFSEFVVGTNDGGGFIRRGNVAGQDASLPVRLTALKMWSSGMMWQATPNPPTDPAAADLRRWFPVRGAAGRSGIESNAAKFAPSPSSACSGIGVWLALPRLYRWKPDSEEWSDAPQADGVRAFECMGEERLMFLTGGGDARVSDGDRTRTKFSEPTHQFRAAAHTQERLHIGGLRGSLLTFEDDALTTVTEGLRIPVLPRDGLGVGGHSDLWVSEDASTAMLIESNNLHRLTSSEPSPFDRDIVNTNGWLREAAASEVWGIDEPQFALAPEMLFTRQASDWEKSEYFDTLDDFEGVDIAGRSNDAVWVAADENLYRYDGESWNRLSGSDSPLRTTIDSEDLTLTRLLVEESGDVHVAAGSRIYQLKKRDGGWKLTGERTAPCDRVSAMHRGQDGSLWIAGGTTCVGRYDGQNWSLFTLEFRRGLSTASVPPDPLNSWEFVRQPGSDRPLIVGPLGILQPTPNDALQRTYAAEMVDAVYLESLDVTLALHEHGILAKYYQN
jgi:hypothetical protein